MDFKRIQVLLILFFLAFDLYLGFLIVDRGTGVFTANQSSEVVNVMQEMRNRGVKIDQRVTINTDTPNLSFVKTQTNNDLRSMRHQLENQTVSIDADGVLTSQFINPVKLDISLSKDNQVLTDEDFTWIRENVLKDPTLFIHGDQYLNRWYSPQERLLIIRMVTDAGNQSADQETGNVAASQLIPFADGSSEIRILLDEDYNMTSYMQSYQTPAQSLEDTRQLLSSYNALEIIENKIDTALPNDASIVSLNLSYYQSVETKEFSVYTPAWEVIYYRQDGGQTQTVLVDALRGKVVESKAFPI